MPATRLSKTSVTNAVAAAVAAAAAGLTPTEINIQPDGSFQIVFLQKNDAVPVSTSNADHPPISLVSQRNARLGKS